MDALKKAHIELDRKILADLAEGDVLVLDPPRGGCGEKVLTPDVARVLYNKVQKKEFVEQTVRIPVVDGTYA
jgi:hypothetical protein